MAQEELRQEFRRFVQELGDDMKKEDFENLKALLRGRTGYGSGVLQKITTARKFFERMEDNGDLSTQNIIYLWQLLKDIHRMDLCNKVEDFEKRHGLQNNAE